MKKKTKKFLLIVLTLNLLAVGIAVFVFLQIRDVNQQAHSIQQEIIEERERSQDLSSLRAFFESIEDSKEVVDEYFITSNEIVEFIEYIEGLDDIAGTNTSLDSVDVGQKDGRARLNLAFNSFGSFEQVYHMLELIENSPFKIDVGSMYFEQLTFDDELVSPGDWQGNFEIHLLSFEEI